MATSQNTPRGVWSSKKYLVGASNITADSTGLVLSAGVKISNKANAVLTGDSTGVVATGGIKLSNKANAVLTGNSTGVVANAGIKISNALTLTADSTGLVAGDTIAALPGDVDGGAELAFILNSTGNFAIGINTTGTTWKYLSTTSALPT